MPPVYPQSAALTERQTTVSLPVEPRNLDPGVSLLEVDVTSLSNPALVPIGIDVSLVSGNLKAEIGSFAFYPADHPGNFSLDCRSALKKMRNKTNLRLVYELRKLRASAEWQAVRVTIGPPKWRIATAK